MYCRLLIVDDDIDIIHALRRELMAPPHVGTDGLEIESFTTPAEALVRVAQADSAFDVVIADYHMPGMDGITLLHYVARQQPNAVRILLTGLIDFDGALGAINDARVDHLLAKPWHEYDLKGRIALALHQRQMVASRTAEGVASLPPAALTQPYRLLIVDDEVSVIAALTREISQQGRFTERQHKLFTIATADSATTALTVAEHFQPDLVIADYAMPGMDGIQLLHQIQARWPGCVRILMSGRADVEVLMDAINIAGVYHFIAKPWERSALHSLLAEALRYRSLCFGPFFGLSMPSHSD